MKTLKNILLLFAIIITAGCNTADNHLQMPAAPDYGNPKMWYTSQENQDADVFYILPTCVWDWTDSSGRTCHYADVYNPDHIKAMLPSNILADSIFGKVTNFYSPYYRQITLESWMEGEQTVQERFPHAMNDIRMAFRYYMENENGGRPFILAGFSQGAKCVVELLKTLDREESSRLIAAYVIGYRVTEDEIKKYTAIKPASGADDTGVTICYNSADSPENMCPVLSPSAICINPVNWKTDSTPATIADTVTVAVHPDHKILVVSGLDNEKYYLPVLGNLFSKGNYHLLELELYKETLTENVEARTVKFLSGTGRQATL